MVLMAPTARTRDFFERYAKLSTGTQIEALAGLYAPTFIVGSPQGSQAYTNDSQFLEWLRQVGDFNRHHGMRSVAVIDIRELVLSPVHVLATVKWGVQFEKTGDQLIEFDSSYLLERAEDTWKILAYVTAADQIEEMRKGL